MVINYGGCAINIKTTSNTVDLTDWTYEIGRYPYQGEKAVFLLHYIGNKTNVVVPEIIP